MGRPAGSHARIGILGRIRKAIHALTADYPDVPDSADMQEETEDMPGYLCRWFEATYRCRSPVNEGENLPGGCDTHCPARLQMEERARYREQENNARIYF